MSVNSTPAQPACAADGGSSPAPIAPAAIDVSCRLPLLVLFLSAGVWLLAASAFGLIASIKFHVPGFLADPAWLTYGRVHPAAVNCMLYGFCLPAGLGVGLWLLARLGRSLLAAPWLIVAGALCCDLGLALGILGILRGGSTGFENLEMPGYAASLIFLGHLMVVFWGLVTFHQRAERQLYVSQWFLVAALLWFPWIYSTANLLLQGFGARGMAQAVTAWWYSDNLLVVWLGLVGLAAVLYFVPKLMSRDLHSRYLALLAFWMIILFGSCGGIPPNAPVPAWLPAWSVVATGVGLVTVIAVFLNTRRTLGGKCLLVMSDYSLKFMGAGLISFVLGGLVSAVLSWPALARLTQFTWFTVGKGLLNYYGFFAMVMFGAIYCIVPQVMGRAFPFPKLVRVHFWVAAAGVVVFVVPLAMGGIVQGIRLQHAEVPFTDIARGTLPFLRWSTMGDLLLALGHVLFLANVGGLVFQFYHARALCAWAEATAEIEVAEARS
jgi:cytochrome c oxidase cbb3-type subunit 1